MKAARSTALAAANPEKQLETFISKFDQKDQQLIRCGPKGRAQMVSDRQRAGVDNYNFFCTPVTKMCRR